MGQDAAVDFFVLVGAFLLQPALLHGASLSDEGQGGQRYLIVIVQRELSRMPDAALPTTTQPRRRSSEGLVAGREVQEAKNGLYVCMAAHGPFPPGFAVNFAVRNPPSRSLLDRRQRPFTALLGGIPNYRAHHYGIKHTYSEHHDTWRECVGVEPTPRRVTPGQRF